MRVVLSLVLSLALASAPVMAANEKNEVTVKGPRKHLSVIVLSGLAGAVLGLSTLSFYGRPQDRLSNIAAGFAFGIIGGAIFTTYKAAAEPRDFYNLRDIEHREMWASHDELGRRGSINPNYTPTLDLRLSF